MKEEAKKRLERLMQDLQEIQESSPLTITCAVITSTAESPLRTQATWQWVAQFLRASRPDDDNIVLDPKPIVVESFTDGKGCVRWCGLGSKRDAFKEWVTRLSGFFESNPELIPNAEPRYGIEGGLQALCAIADPVPELSTLIKRRRILQLAGLRTLPPKTPIQIQKMKPRPSFDVMEIDATVPLFSLAVLNHLLGRPTRLSRIEVQIDKSPKAQYANVIVDGDREYVYYRCTQYHKGEHPRTRLTEGELDAQMLALFDKLRVEDAEFRDTFREQLRMATNWELGRSSQEDSELKKRHTEVVRQQGQLLNLRLLEEIDADTYAAKAQELRDEEAGLRLQIEGASRNRNETIDIAIKAFELSQNLRAKWFAADWAAKRRILEIVCLNWKLDGVSLVPEWRKPFDLLAEGLLTKDSRGDRI